MKFLCCKCTAEVASDTEERTRDIYDGSASSDEGNETTFLASVNSS